MSVTPSGALAELYTEDDVELMRQVASGGGTTPAGVLSAPQAASATSKGEAAESAPYAMCGDHGAAARGVLAESHTMGGPVGRVRRAGRDGADRVAAGEGASTLHRWRTAHGGSGKVGDGTTAAQHDLLWELRTELAFKNRLLQHCIDAVDAATDVRLNSDRSAHRIARAVAKALAPYKGVDIAAVAVPLDGGLGDSTDNTSGSDSDWPPPPTPSLLARRERRRSSRRAVRARRARRRSSDQSSGSETMHPLAKEGAKLVLSLEVPQDGITFSDTDDGRSQRSRTPASKRSATPYSMRSGGDTHRDGAANSGNAAATWLQRRHGSVTARHRPPLPTKRKRWRVRGLVRTTTHADVERRGLWASSVSAADSESGENDGTVVTGARAADHRAAEPPRSAADGPPVAARVVGVASQTASAGTDGKYAMEIVGATGIDGPARALSPPVASTEPSPVAEEASQPRAKGIGRSLRDRFNFTSSRAVDMAELNAGIDTGKTSPLRVDPLYASSETLYSSRRRRNSVHDGGYESDPSVKGGNWSSSDDQGSTGRGSVRSADDAPGSPVRGMNKGRRRRSFAHRHSGLRGPLQLSASGRQLLEAGLRGDVAAELNFGPDVREMQLSPLARLDTDGRLGMTEVRQLVAESRQGPWRSRLSGLDLAKQTAASRGIDISASAVLRTDGRTASSGSEGSVLSNGELMDDALHV